jgi:ABC-type bacteriocin/lantibiotic exporter with double-glycine peptidase domain
MNFRFLFLVPLSAFYCWQLTLAGLSICLLELGLLFVFGKRIQEIFEQLTMKDESARLAVEIIENVRTMQLLVKQVGSLTLTNDIQFPPTHFATLCNSLVGFFRISS